MQAARPRSVLAPLQVGLGVQAHFLFRSRLLNDILYNLGFAVSYDEVRQFEGSAAISDDIRIQFDASVQSLQFVADNVDHNIATLDGHGTFHGMGIIACVSPGLHSFQRASIPRMTNVPSSEVLRLGKVNISVWKQPLNQKSSLKFEPIVLPDPHDIGGLDVFWRTAWVADPDQRPGWGGGIYADDPQWNRPRQVYDQVLTHVGHESK
jgi:hypothetical protein